jgi:predicted P-loop ATPase
MTTETTTTTETVTQSDQDKIKHIVKADASSTTRQRIRTVLELDPEFETLCYDVTKYHPMINGDSLQDRDLAMITSYLTDEYKHEVCTFTGLRANDLSIKMVKEAVEAEAYATPFNPRTKYVLDCYQQHGDNGVALLDVWLEKVGCTIDDDKKPLLGALGRKYFIQIIARILHPACQADMGLILHDPVGDKSKSKLRRTLAVKSEWINESGIGDLKDEKKTGELVSPYLFVIFDENSSLTRGELGAPKKAWTLTKDTYRSAYDIYATDKPRQSVFGGTTNVLNLFLDEGGIARRFPIIDVSDVDIEWLEEHRDQLYAAAFHIYCQNLKEGKLAYDPAVDHGYEPVTIHNGDYKSVDERISQNVHWWFSEKHESELYVMLAALSARTLVTLGWQDDLEAVLSMHVGRKMSTRELKTKTGTIFEGD